MRAGGPGQGQGRKVNMKTRLQPMADGVVVNPLLYKKIGPTSYYIQKAIPTFCLYKKSDRLFRTNKKIGPIFGIYKNWVRFFVNRKKSVRFFVFINKKSERYWYMLKLHKSYIFVQGKIKNGTKTQTKNLTDFLYIQKIGSIYFRFFCTNKMSERFIVLV